MKLRGVFVCALLACVLLTMEALPQGQFYGQNSYKSFALDDNESAQAVKQFFESTPKDFSVLVIGTSNVPSYGLYRAYSVYNYALSIGFTKVSVSFRIENRRGVYLYAFAPEQDNVTHNELDWKSSELESKYNNLSNFLVDKYSNLENRVSALEEEPIVITDSSMSARFYLHLGASGVVNVFTREPLYGGGAQTQISFPAFNGMINLGGSFDGTVISTFNVTYKWRVATLLDELSIYGSLGGFYSSYPQESAPAKKWIGVPTGVVIAYPIGGFAYLTGSFDIMPFAELLQDNNRAKVRGLTNHGLAVYGSIGISVPTSVPTNQ